MSNAHLLDPRQVVTPIDPDSTETLLRKYNLFQSFNHIVHGLKFGFDVGVRTPPNSTILFRKSQILHLRYHFHLQLHSSGTSSWSLLACIFYSGAGIRNWTFSHCPSWPSSQTGHLLISNDSGPILPTQQAQLPIYQCWGGCSRISDNLGFFRSHLRTHSFPTERLRSCNFRHISCLPNHTGATRPTSLLMCLVGWCSVCRQSGYVRISIECWSIWGSCRHVNCYLQGGGLVTYHEMGGRFSGHPPSRRDLDRG